MVVTGIPVTMPASTGSGPKSARWRRAAAEGAFGRLAPPSGIGCFRPKIKRLQENMPDV
jgi:hypothetical protein